MPAPPKCPNIGSQTDRAVAAWLQSQNCGWITDGPPALSALITPAYSPNVILTYPVIKCHAARSSQDTPLTYNSRFNFQIRVEQTAVTDVGEENPENQRVILDQLVGQVLYQMLQSEDGQSLNFTAANITAAGRSLANTGSDQSQLNNSDMDNFTIQYLFWRGQTRGEPSETGCAWVEVLNFESICNPAQLTM